MKLESFAYLIFLLDIIIYFFLTGERPAHIHPQQGHSSRRVHLLLEAPHAAGDRVRLVSVPVHQSQRGHAAGVPV